MQIKKSFNSMPHKQRGLVMLMVVGVVVLMITLLALMLEDQHILIRQVSNQRVSEQSQHYSRGLEAWAIRVLHEDQNRQVDFADEKWAKMGRPEVVAEDDENTEFSLDPTLRLGSDDEEEEATIDFGIDTIEVTIDDLQGRYNLNNLISGQKDVAPPVDQRRIFLNLLQVLEIGEFQEDRNDLYSALVDWLDENDTSTAGIGNGAESNDYKIRSTPYFAGDQPLSSLGELKYVKGFNKEMITKLRPYVSILPIQGAKLNLNSITPQVMAALNQGPVADTAPVESFLARKQDPAFLGFQNGDIQAANTAINGVSPGNAFIPNMLQVNSQFFQINSKVILGDYQVCTRTIVLRQSANPDTLSKQSISVLNREQDTVCKLAEDEQSVSASSDSPDSISDENLR